MNQENICQCGHEKEKHLYDQFGCATKLEPLTWCSCPTFRPAPSQPSLKSPEVIAVSIYPESLKGSSVWPDRGEDKIEGIIKEFRERFVKTTMGGETLRQAHWEEVEKWLTQTLTTILNGE